MSDSYYAEVVSGYEDFLRGKTHPRAKKAVDLLAPVSSERLLDVGCGRGDVIREGSKRCEAIGIDFSEASMDFARSQGLSAVRGSVTNLPFKGEAFDEVSFMEVIEHLTENELRESLREIHRILKTGGRFVVQLTTHPYGEFPFDFILKIYLRLSDRYGKFYTDWKTREQVLHLAKKDFEIIGVEEEGSPGFAREMKTLVKRGIIPFRILWIFLKKGP